MGCNSSVEISLEVEYAAKGPNGYGFQDNVSENGVYTFRVDASNSWDCEFSPEKRKFYLYALPPLTTKVKKVDIAANIDVATSEGSENISDFKISLAVIDAQGSIISSSVLLDKVDVNRNILLPFSQDSEVVKTAKVGCRYKIMCTAGAGNAVVKVTISALQICVVSAKDHVAPVRPPFEESVTEDSAIFSLYSPRPWCWGSTKARAINWVSTPILSSGCSKIVASFIIDIDHALDPAKASTYFNAASLDLVLVRHGKVISSEQILFVNQAAIEMAKNKPLQHSIDHTSRKSSRKLLAKCSPGDILILVRKVSCDLFCRFLVKQFRLELHPSHPGVPSARPQREIKHCSALIATDPSLAQDVSSSHIAINCDDTPFLDEQGRYRVPIGYIPVDGRTNYGAYGEDGL